MKEALNTVDQISGLVNTFYQQALKDEIIGPFFNEAMESRIEDHLPIIINFWSSLILDTNSYKGNPMLRHIELNQKMELKQKHFDRWLEIWFTTIDQFFEGAKAELAKTKAAQIAQLIQLKIAKSNSSSYLL